MCVVLFFTLIIPGDHYPGIYWLEIYSAHMRANHYCIALIFSCQYCFSVIITVNELFVCKFILLFANCKILKNNHFLFYVVNSDGLSHTVEKTLEFCVVYELMDIFWKLCSVCYTTYHLTGLVGAAIIAPYLVKPLQPVWKLCIHRENLCSGLHQYCYRNEPKAITSTIFTYYSQLVL